MRPIIASNLDERTVPGTKAATRIGQKELEIKYGPSLDNIPAPVFGKYLKSKVQPLQEPKAPDQIRKSPVRDSDQVVRQRPPSSEPEIPLPDFSPDFDPIEEDEVKTEIKTECDADVTQKMAASKPNAIIREDPKLRVVIGVNIA